MLAMLRSGEWKRPVLRGLLIGLLFMLGSCAYWTTYPLHAQTADSTIVINAVHVDSSMVEWFARYREILPVEDVICIYGLVRGDTAFVTFMKPTRTWEASLAMVYYDPCPRPSPEYFGPVVWLGTWHSHNGGLDGERCGFSVLDDRSFHAQGALVELLTCSSGMKVRGRKK